jgi:hypothetical protein
MLDSDINETGLRKGMPIEKGQVPSTIPPVRSDEADRKNNSSKTLDVKKE